MSMSRIAIAFTGLAALAATVLTAGALATTKAATVSVTAGKPTEFGFKLSTKTVKHGAVTFKITNGGNLPHDFKICSSNKGGTANSCKGTVSKMVNPGQSTTLKDTFKSAGKYEYLCTVPGHAAGGMKGVLKVT
jgi:uncharacterized cupredoxin-like copper-binding protein